MFKNILIFAICCNVVVVVVAQRAPLQLPWYSWATRLMFYRIINMTAEIVHDTTQKIKQAGRIRDLHKHSITYELGTISAGIQERFHRMLKTYRQYASNKVFEDGTYTIQETLYAYHTMQGDYNEIRLEKSLFYEIKKRHEGYQSTTPNFKKALLGSITPKDPRTTEGGGGRRRKWSPKEEQFYNFKS